MYNNAKLFVSTYAKYNNGTIKGQWVTLSDYATEQDFLDACFELHSDEEDIELMFQDFGEFPKSLYSESSAPSVLWDLFPEDEDEEAFEAFIDAFGVDIDLDALDNFRDAYEGKWDSEKDFAYHIFDALYAGTIPDHMETYFDYEKFARDLFMGDYTYHDGYVFNSNW